MVQSVFRAVPALIVAVAVGIFTGQIACAQQQPIKRKREFPCTFCF
jgi:hypothetical protein